MRLQEVYETYKDRADFYLIYIREAHASDSFRPARHVDIEQPKDFETRSKVAKGCGKALDLGMPILVDDMQDSVSKAYHAHPDRLFIVGADNKVKYRGDRGPRGFKVDEMEAALKMLLVPTTGE